MGSPVLEVVFCARNARRGLQQPRHLLGAKHGRYLARLPHECEVPGHLGAVERHGEKEAQRRHRAVDARRTDASPGLMQLKTAKILSDGLIRRTSQKRCESLDLPDI